MITLAAFALVTALRFPAPAVEADGVLRSTIRVDGVSWSLVAKSKPITVFGFAPAELIRFTVRREGVFAFSRGELDGGRLIGMKFGHDRPSATTVRPFPEERPRGWILSTWSHCGNTVGRSYLVVAPDTGTRAEDATPMYRQVEGRSADEPTVHLRDGVVEVWGSYQEWGGGGTWSSTYVPFRHVVGEEGEILRRPLPPKLSSWPRDILQGDRPCGPLGVFTAGLREESPELMRAALTLLPDMSDAEQVASYRDCSTSFGLPATREALEKTIDDMEIILAARRRLRAACPGPALGDPIGR